MKSSINHITATEPIVDSVWAENSRRLVADLKFQNEMAQADRDIAVEQLIARLQMEVKNLTVRLEDNCCIESDISSLAGAVALHHSTVKGAENIIQQNVQIISQLTKI